MPSVGGPGCELHARSLKDCASACKVRIDCDRSFALGLIGERLILRFEHCGDADLTVRIGRRFASQCIGQQIASVLRLCSSLSIADDPLLDRESFGRQRLERDLRTA